MLNVRTSRLRGRKVPCTFAFFPSSPLYFYTNNRGRQGNIKVALDRQYRTFLPYRPLGPVCSCISRHAQRHLKTA
ncbi:hypothetical protein DTO027B5_6012 [Paecilomyces variotii]|nr:hypothetical protein DTO032I3_7720 [Paecilomyces variotii]KAJ9276250.1 hypothetical protein DTO021D3_6881 [Paecilomyces variotii]KAJ9332205.1 hypothetical protein DTO027B5_6012 [Paecilomyces variotii]KAJ9340133.1 hypothetical protein DTO027B6_7330 [Paecilomyces variotii]KAJ9359457.1 hypothetical protein DTO027B9_1971 [Paecilomyces variotii]